MNEKTKPTNQTPLTALLRACTPAQRSILASRAGTSVNYLYSLAGCHRERVNVALALAIEDASRELHWVTDGATPVITARELSTMCLIGEFDDLSAN